jgi:spore germination cell wall hydrolase CwlJ-like protein
VDKNDLHNLDDVTLLALLVYGEARGEPIEGQVAVACVVRNRVKQSNKPWQDVMLQPLQFSCFNSDDPNLQKILALAEKPELGGRILQQCRWVAEGVYGELILDNTGGATHYVTHPLYTSPKAPEWVHELQFCGAVGRHVFLR